MNNEQTQASCVPVKWYHNELFPMLPVIHLRAANKHNTSSFRFHWLVFRAWSMDNVELNFQFSLSDVIQIRAMVPYLIFGIFIPILPWSFLYRFWRKPKLTKDPYSE